MDAKKKEKLKFYPTEKVVVLPIRRTLKGYKYAVSNYGRLIRFGKEPEDGVFSKQMTAATGYPSFSITSNGNRTFAYAHRLVAQYFLPKPSKNEVYVIHKDRDKANNRESNLKWVTISGHLEHAMKGEAWKKARRISPNTKLTEDRVRIIRRKIKEGKTRMKIIARQFGVSDMQLYRIKSGENWGWVN